MTRATAWILGLAVTAVLLAGCNDAPQPKAAADDGTLPDVTIDAGQGKGAIDGVVVDEAIRPIPGAIVVVQPIGVSAVADSLGKFAIEGLEPGAFVINATHADYLPAQATVEVFAGKPAVVTVKLQATRNLAPNVVQVAFDLYVAGGFCVATYCNKVVSGNDDRFNVHDIAYVEFDEKATAVQAEVTWDSTVSPLSDNGQLDCYTVGEDADGSTVITGLTVAGVSPVTLRMPGTWTDDGEAIQARSIGCEFSNANGDAPASLMGQQQAKLYVHTFYNFEPDPDWTFIADGDYPVPPR